MSCYALLLICLGLMASFPAVKATTNQKEMQVATTPAINTTNEAKGCDCEVCCDCYACGCSSAVCGCMPRGFCPNLATEPKLPTASGDFDDFKKKFARNYLSQHENDYRRRVFFDNLALINAENAKGKSYKLGVGNFADLTFTEFKKHYLGGFAPQKNHSSLGAFQAPVGFVADNSVDWVAKGAVTPVKNQAQCGSCWSFSTTGALEGASFIAGRTLTSLSEQNILDCDKGGNKCQGGSMDQAFGWVATNGLLAEKDDTYKCADQASDVCTNSKCPAKGAATQVLKPGDVTGHTDVDQTEGALEAAVMKQPVSVAIEADQAVFQHYKSGVLTNDACGENLDHGVLVVGYGTDSGQKYWKVKNSWGAVFGEAGYIRIERGDAAAGGECGIRKMASFPTVKAITNQKKMQVTTTQAINATNEAEGCDCKVCCDCYACGCSSDVCGCMPRGFCPNLAKVAPSVEVIV